MPCGWLKGHTVVKLRHDKEIANYRTTGIQITVAHVFAANRCLNTMQSLGKIEFEVRYAINHDRGTGT